MGNENGAQQPPTGYGHINATDPDAEADTVRQARLQRFQQSNRTRSKQHTPTHHDHHDEKQHTESVRLDISKVTGKKKDKQKVKKNQEMKPWETDQEHQARLQVAAAAERRLEKSTAPNVGKSKREKNYEMIFDPTVIQQSVSTRTMFMELKEHTLLVDDDLEIGIYEGLYLLKDIDAQDLKKTLSIMRRIVKNIIKQDSQKFRRIRASNEAVRDRIISVEGALHVMLVVGFCLDSFEDDLGIEDDFLHFPHDVPVENLITAVHIIDIRLWKPLNVALESK